MKIIKYGLRKTENGEYKYIARNTDEYCEGELIDDFRHSYFAETEAEAENYRNILDEPDDFEIFKIEITYKII